MKILCDTNILVRMAMPNDPDHAVAVASWEKLVKAGHQCVLVPQCLYEYFVVATRPVENNGLGLTPERAIADINRLVSIMPLLNDDPTIFAAWKVCVVDFEVSGKQGHDARLVAAMESHGVDHLLTFNGKHFKRFNKLKVFSPSEVVKDDTA